MAQQAIPLKQLDFLFKDGADFENLSIDDLLPEILQKKPFFPSDLERDVVEIAKIISTNAAFDGQISSKFEAKNEKSGTPGVLYARDNFLHFDKEASALYVFQDYDASGNPLKNIQGLDQNDNLSYFNPLNLFDAYEDDLIKTFTDGH